jgi:hypothetical protein
MATSRLPAWLYKHHGGWLDGGIDWEEVGNVQLLRRWLQPDPNHVRDTPWNPA